MDYKLPPLPERDLNANKGTFGKILNIAGSKYMPGAAYISSVAAMTAGCGLVCLMSEESVIKAVSAQTSIITFTPLSELEEKIRTFTVLLIGCGLSASDEAVNIFKRAIEYSKIPTIIDADGLNILAKNQIKLPVETILTPHPLEAARLIGCELHNVLADTEKAAREICARYNCVTVLKSHETIVTDGERIFKNATETSALAKGGSGDVLAGVIASLTAQGLELFDAAALGVHLHGLSGDLAAKNLTEYCVTANDTIRFLPNAFINYAK